MLPASPAGLGWGRRRLQDAEAQATPGMRGWAGSGDPPCPPLPRAGQLGPSWATCLCGEAKGRWGRREEAESRQVPSVIAFGHLKGIV